MAIDFDIYNVQDIDISGIDYNDNPESNTRFADAYVKSATRNGISLTDEELEELNEQDKTREWLNDKLL